MEPDLEAKVFTNYLIGRDATVDVIERYKDYTGKIPPDATVSFLCRNPFWIGCVDTWHAMFKKRSVLRKKLFFLFCVLETQPEYASDFLAPERHSLMGITWKLFVSVLKLIPGGIISLFAR